MAQDKTSDRTLVLSFCSEETRHYCTMFCVLLKFILTHFLTEIAETSPEFFMDHSFTMVSVLWHNYTRFYLLDVGEERLRVSFSGWAIWHLV